MAAQNEQFRLFLTKLNERRQAGVDARKQLAARLAAMTAFQLKAVSPAVLVRLGPETFAEVASRSAALKTKTSDLETRATAIVASSVNASREPGAFENISTAFEDLQRRKPLLWEAVKRFIVAMMLATIVVLTAPLAMRALKPPTIENGHRLCTRLDGFTGDCVFRTSGGRITLRRAAEYLSRPVEWLSQANPTIPVDYPLPSGIHIDVPRRTGLNLR